MVTRNGICVITIPKIRAGRISERESQTFFFAILPIEAAAGVVAVISVSLVISWARGRRTVVDPELVTLWCYVLLVCVASGLSDLLAFIKSFLDGLATG